MNREEVAARRAVCVELKDWLDLQKETRSKERQQRVRVAFEFMQKFYESEKAILSELRCIDFSREVHCPILPKGLILVGAKDPRVSPYRSRYFTRPGYPISRLGVADQGNLKSNLKLLPKTFYRYEVLVTIPAGAVLESICAPAADLWSIKRERVKTAEDDSAERKRIVEGVRVLAGGGGLQYLIPEGFRYLRFLTPGT